MPSNNNVNPFLANVNLLWNGSSNLSSVSDFKVYLSQLGTLTYGTPASFLDLGGGLSTPAWQPKFAARRKLGTTAVDDIFVYAPVKSFLGNYLTTKTIRTNSVGDVFVCPDSYGFTEPNVDQLLPKNCSTCTVNLFPYIASVSPNYVSISASLPLIAQDDCTNNVFRSASFSPEPEISHLALSATPNPADKSIHVTLSGETDLSHSVNLILIDLYGRKVKILFDGPGGSSSELANDFDVSMLAPGIYMIQALVDGKACAPIRFIKN